MLRVSPSLSEGQGQPPVLRIDPSKKRVTVMEPSSRSVPHATMTLDRNGKNLLKTVNFDAAYPQESSQVRAQVHPDFCSTVFVSVSYCLTISLWLFHIDRSFNSVSSFWHIQYIFFPSLHNTPQSVCSLCLMT